MVAIIIPVMLILRFDNRSKTEHSNFKWLLKYVIGIRRGSTVYNSHTEKCRYAQCFSRELRPDASGWPTAAAAERWSQRWAGGGRACPSVRAGASTSRCPLEAASPLPELSQIHPESSWIPLGDVHIVQRLLVPFPGFDGGHNRVALQQIKEKNQGCSEVHNS